MRSWLLSWQGFIVLHRLGFSMLDCQEALTWMRARKHWINGTTWQESQCHGGLPSLRLLFVGFKNQMQFSKMQFEDSKFLWGNLSITINFHTHGVSYLACAFAIAWGREWFHHRTSSGLETAGNTTATVIPCLRKKLGRFASVNSWICFGLSIWMRFRN